ncbi:MAG: purine-nucleoside phosphorylase [Streptomyces sp.]|nr:purine-nucleoside phosphorylase [Streptomyces sp.]
MSEAMDDHRLAESAADALAKATDVERHDVAVVLGSGLAAAAEVLGDATTVIDIASLPGFLAPTAIGHPGQVRSSTVAGLRVLCFIGRTHLYEGHGPGPVAHAVRTAAAAGCRAVVLTNACGSLRPDLLPGSGVVIGDHLNLSGTTPLVGPRFIDLGDVWSRRLRTLAVEVDPALAQGVYAMVPGPQYQTTAEARMFRALGADVIGMSTVLEAIAACELGLETLGLSVVTSTEGTEAVTDPERVVEIAESAAHRFGAVIKGVLERGFPPRLQVRIE